MKRIISKSGLLAGLLAGLLLSPGAWGAEGHAADNPGTPGALKARMESRLSEQHVPGLSYAVFDRNGMVFAEALGQSDLAQHRPMTANTLMRAGSITKMLTAIAVMQLIEQGRFSLSTPVRELLPEAPIVNPWESTDPVRVVNLLEHTAGFDDASLGGLFREREATDGHLNALLSDRKPLTARWRPGTMMSYSGPGYAVLGALIEKQTGLTWEDAVRRNVLRPLGMKHSVLTIAEAGRREHSLGYDGSEMRNLPLLPFSTRADGALWSTPEDMSKLGRFLMTDGSSAPGVLTFESVREMKNVHSTLAARQGLAWGYGLAVQHTAGEGADWLGHDGAVYGAGASLRYQPARGLGYVVMYNTENVDAAIGSPVASYIVAQQALAAVRPTPVAFTGNVEGWYRRRDSRPELGAGVNWLLGVVHATVSGNRLHLTPLAGGPVVVSTSDNRLLTDEALGGLKLGALIRQGDTVTAIDYDGQFTERVSAFSALAPAIGIALSLLALLTAPFGRRKALNNPWLRRLPTLALGALIASLALLFQLEITSVAKVNGVSIGIFLGTLLFPVFAVAGLALSLKTWNTETAGVARWRCLLGSLGAVGISIFFAAFHWFALALWAW